MRKALYEATKVNNEINDLANRNWLNKAYIVLQRACMVMFKSRYKK